MIEQGEAKALHDKHITRKEFSLQQKVLLYDSRLQLFLEKLVKMLAHGATEIKDPTKDQAFKVNRYKLNHLLQMSGEGDVESLLLYNPPQV